jgi:hypothetical protein
LLTVNVLPSAIAKVAEEAGAVIASLLMLVAVAAPSVGVVSEGEFARTTLPEPVVEETDQVPAAITGIPEEPEVSIPVPPFAALITVAFQEPVPIVPSVVTLVVPAQVDRAVFSTFPKPKPVRAPESVVAPVPPFAIAKVPAIVIVPSSVIGPPENVSPVVPPETSTLVTVPDPPPPPSAAIVIDPDPFVIDIPVPAVKFASVKPLPFPIKSLPFAAAEESTPVPPFAAEIVVAFQVPVPTVPKSVTLLDPDQVLSLVFSTLPKPKLVRAEEADVISERLLTVRSAPTRFCSKIIQSEPVSA